ncbi:MAG TPA: hypothetical protein PK765_05775 [bacterium]|nr:hypothetical protein [bacterium]
MLPKEQIETIVFDIDGTIAPGVSWLRMTEQLGASVAEHERIYRDMIAGITDLNEAKSELVALWGATGNARKDLFREMFDLFPLDDGVDSMIASL